MHVEKNICESVVRTFLVKKTIKVRWEHGSWRCSPTFWLTWYPHNQQKILKPQAPYVLTGDELNTFWSRLGSLKVSTNYGASLAKHMANKKLGSMNTHDYHLLMQQLFPLCLQRLMAIKPQMVIMWLSCVFHKFVWRCGTLIKLGACKKMWQSLFPS